MCRRLTEALALVRQGSWDRGFLLVQRANAHRRTRQLEQAVADAKAAHTPLVRYGDAWLTQGMALLDAGRPDEAVRVFETLLRADYDFPHVGYWMLAAHARARRYAAGPVTEGFRVGDKVRFRANQPGFWNSADTAEVLGLGSPLGPILIKLDKEGRTIHCEGTHFDKARAHTPTHPPSCVTLYSPRLSTTVTIVISALASSDGFPARAGSERGCGRLRLRRGPGRRRGQPRRLLYDAGAAHRLHRPGA